MARTKQAARKSGSKGQAKQLEQKDRGSKGQNEAKSAVQNHENHSHNHDHNQKQKKKKKKHNKETGEPSKDYFYGTVLCSIHASMSRRLTNVIDAEQVDLDKHRALNIYVRKHDFVRDSTDGFTTSQRRAFERDVYDEARRVGMSSIQAKAQVTIARKMCGEVHYNSDHSAMEGEQDDPRQSIAKFDQANSVGVHDEAVVDEKTADQQTTQMEEDKMLAKKERAKSTKKVSGHFDVPNLSAKKTKKRKRDEMPSDLPKDAMLETEGYAVLHEGFVSRKKTSDMPPIAKEQNHRRKKRASKDKTNLDGHSEKQTYQQGLGNESDEQCTEQPCTTQNTAMHLDQVMNTAERDPSGSQDVITTQISGLLGTGNGIESPSDVLKKSSTEAGHEINLGGGDHVAQRIGTKMAPEKHRTNTSLLGETKSSSEGRGVYQGFSPLHVGKSQRAGPTISDDIGLTKTVTGIWDVPRMDTETRSYRLSPCKDKKVSKSGTADYNIFSPTGHSIDPASPLTGKQSRKGFY
jgi:hypothetical protein